ncbi:MAG TPA: c-type cytochrome [Gemmataceae bacterium]|nr:c-type cytochrome [Gemmataceae bacterium]
MIRSRRALVVLAVLLLAGCGRVKLPTDGPRPLTPAAAGYPVRTDPLAIGVPTGVPPRFPTPGYHPLRSLQLGTKSPDADFADQLRQGLGKTILDPQTTLSAVQRDDLGRLLDGHFGSPAAPSVHLPTPDAARKLALYEFDPGKGAFANLRKILGRFGDWGEAVAATRELELNDAALARGGVLYRRWCLHCHGGTGAGDGSQAAQLGAIPRDYRQGLFKFVSAFPQTDPAPKGAKGKALKADLKRTIRNGLDGTMMPPFPQFSDAELDDLAGYVVHLAVRGEVEFEVMARTIQVLTNPSEVDPEYSPEFLEQTVDLQTILVVQNWGRAARSPIPIPPEATPTEEARWESAVRGYKAFAARGCMGCHDNYGRVQQLKYDSWGTVVRPRDLTLGVYRGGRRGEDLYARVYGGIYPSTMPDYTANLKLNPSVPGVTDEVWDVVHFLQALSDPRGRQTLSDRLRREKEKDSSLNVIPFE